MVDLSSPAAERSEKEISYPLSRAAEERVVERSNDRVSQPKRAKATLTKKSRKSFHPINQGSDK
jgi:hypothetical protein